MTLLIAETLADSLTRLTVEAESRQDHGLDLQLATSHQSLATSPGMSFYRFDGERQERRVSTGATVDGSRVGRGLCSGRPVDIGRDPSKQQEAA